MHFTVVSLQKVKKLKEFQSDVQTESDYLH